MIKIETLNTLAALALKLGEVDRATFHPDGTTPETDTTHSVMLAWISATVAQALPGYDPALCAAFATIHDAPEALCGDVNSFGITAEAKVTKDIFEAEATLDIQRSLPLGSWASVMLDRYTAQIEPEARLVRFLDKITPKLTHAMNQCAAIRAMGKTPTQLRMAHVRQLDDLRDEYPELIGPCSQLFTLAAMQAEAEFMPRRPTDAEAYANDGVRGVR